MNVYSSDYGDALEILRVSHEVEIEQRAALAARRAARDRRVEPR